MNKRQALQLLIEAAKKVRQTYAVDANLVKRGLATGPHFKTEYNKYDKLTQAIWWAEAEIEQTQEIKDD